jgi:actin cytoskeleton-regulatory complex protein PAN1
MYLPINETVLRRLDLTVPTRYMGPRKLLKQGVLLKAKSRRKLYALLCSDILVLTDESMKNLYRLVGYPSSSISFPDIYI